MKAVTQGRGHSATVPSESKMAGMKGPGGHREWLNLRESLQKQAQDILDPVTYGYYSSGAADMTTLKDNEGAFKNWKLRPRVLANVKDVSTNATVCGTSISVPLFIAPMAFHGLADKECELATARAAAAAGVGFCLRCGRHRLLRLFHARRPRKHPHLAANRRGIAHCAVISHRASRRPCRSAALTAPRLLPFSAQHLFQPPSRGCRHGVPEPLAVDAALVSGLRHERPQGHGGPRAPRRAGRLHRRVAPEPRRPLPPPTPASPLHSAPGVPRQGPTALSPPTPASPLRSPPLTPRRPATSPSAAQGSS